MRLFLIFVLCATVACPANCMSRWFTATFNDLKFTLQRFAHCLPGLTPVTSRGLDETTYLVNQIKTFLDQGNYDNEQLANVSSLMDTICRNSPEPNYPISMYINITQYNSTANPEGKLNRCRAIDEAMDPMYFVFKRSATNRSEPLDFSAIRWNGNTTAYNTTTNSVYNLTGPYNLTDLINTSWISSEVTLEHVCVIANQTKEYVQNRLKSSPTNSRASSEPPAGMGVWLVSFFDRLLEPLLGLQKRLYWESTNRLELVRSRLNSGLASAWHGVGGLFARSNSTSVTKNETNNKVTTATTPLPLQANSNRTVSSADGVQLLNQATTPVPSAGVTGKGRLAAATTVGV